MTDSGRVGQVHLTCAQVMVIHQAGVVLARHGPDVICRRRDVGPIHHVREYGARLGQCSGMTPEGAATGQRQCFGRCLICSVARGTLLGERGRGALRLRPMINDAPP